MALAFLISFLLCTFCVCRAKAEEVWNVKDIGVTGALGSSFYDKISGVFTVSGAGADVWGSADSFHFISTAMTGSGEIVARVTSVQNTNPWAKAGVMIRESQAVGSRHAMVVVTPSQGVAFQRRLADGANSYSTTRAGINVPYWVRLVRSGNLFLAYSSPDGVAWEQLGSASIPMGDVVSIGLAVTSHKKGTLCTAKIDNVRIDNVRKTAPLADVLGENTENLPVTASDLSNLWQTTGNVEISRDSQDAQTLSINYNPSQGRVVLNYPLRAGHLIAELLRFRIKGDGSGNTLKMYCYHNPSGQWISLSQVTLNFTGYKHIVIPAQNPVCLYYSTITSFRFELTGSSSGTLKLNSMMLAQPRLVAAPLTAKSIPSPVFDTWGTPPRATLEVSNQVGNTIHIVPISFFDKPLVTNRTAYAKSVLKTINTAGKIAAIQFFNHPGTYVIEHPELLVKNQNGVIQTDGGTFTSPWNPQARQMWHDHIVACLNDLKANNYLQYVNAVQICPGLESEMCYEWSNVWAFDDYAIAAYRNYLKTYYNNDISSLNADWISGYSNFNTIMPPQGWYPDREHWVFTDFYRYSMLEYYVFMANAVKEVFEPQYWMAMPHTLPTYPMRFYSARYPLFYSENLRRLGLLDYAQIAALDWQHKEDVAYLQSIGLRVIGEIDVQPSLYSLDNSARQAKKYGMDGFYMGVLNPMFEGLALSPLGKLANKLVTEYSKPYDPFVFIEDFKNISDWAVGKGSAAGGGTISVDTVNTQEGSSGRLDYQVTAATGFDYVDFNKTVTPTDLSGRKFVFYIKVPPMPNALLQLLIYSTNGGFLEYNFTVEDGKWQRYELKTDSDFANYGTNPDVSRINLIRFRVNGDVSKTAESGSIYLDAVGFVD